MPNVTDEVRDLSANLTELGALETETSVDLGTQATKFDEAWASFEKSPDKALRTLGELSGKLRLEADEKDNDRARDAARNFDSDVQELTRLRQELTAARGRRDQTTVRRLEDQYASSQNRAHNTYELWRRGDVEQYKLKQEELKKKQQRAADDVQRTIDNLDSDIGAEGNEAFGQLRTALVGMQRSLKSGERLKSIKLPGASAFDPKKGRFDQYFESWKRRNRIDENDLRKPRETKKPSEDTRTETKNQKEKNSSSRENRYQQNQESKQRAQSSQIQAKAAATAAVLSGAAQAIGTTVTANAGIAAPKETKNSTDKEKPTKRESPAEARAARAAGRREILSEITDQATPTNSKQEKEETDSVAPIRNQAIPSSTGIPTATNIERQQLQRMASRAEIRGIPGQEAKQASTPAPDIIFTGKIGRRLEKNVEEFEQVKERIIQLEGQISIETVPDEQVIQQLNIEIEQAITLKERLMGDLNIQVEMTASGNPQATGAVAAFAVATLTGASAFVTQAAAAQANRSSAAGFPVPTTIRQASSLQPSDIEGFAKLAAQAGNGDSSTTSTQTQSRSSTQQIQGQNTRLENFSQLIGQSPLSADAGATLSQSLQDLGPPTNANDRDIASQLQNLVPASTASGSALQTPTSATPDSEEVEPFTLDSPTQAAREANLGQAPIRPGTIRRDPNLRGSLPGQPIGTGSRGSDLQNALRLQAGQQANQTAGDEQLRNLLADAGVEDASILQDASLEPVLKLYGRSYTDQQIPDIGPPIAGADEEIGGGYVISDAEQTQRARDLQSQQQSARKGFTGERGDTFLGFAGSALGAIETGAGLSGLRGEIGENISGYTAFENAQARQSVDPSQEANSLLSQQMAETRNKALSQARQKLQKQVKQQIQNLAKKAAQKTATTATRVTVEAAQAVAGPEDGGITWLTLIIEMNIQLILKYVLKGFGFIGKQAISSNREGGIEADIMNEFNDFADSIQTFWEDVLTIWMDCCLQMASCMTTCGPPLFIVFSSILFIFSAVLGIAGIGSKLGVL